jgi:hypothetical protein
MVLGGVELCSGASCCEVHRELSDFLPCRYVPDSHRFLEGRGHNPGALSVESYDRHKAAVRFDGPEGRCLERIAAWFDETAQFVNLEQPQGPIPFDDCHEAPILGEF